MTMMMMMLIVFVFVVKTWMNAGLRTADVLNSATTPKVRSAADVTTASGWNQIEELAPVSNFCV